ncbi:MAG: class I SAM-dependent methyltransferase [Magnetospirillum sp.]|nr:class I SAM-dependent methyltransferase [Magnetospirillum sp.]
MTPLDALLLAVMAAPDDARPLVALAAAHLDADRPGEAAAVLLSALEKAPRDPAALALLGRAAERIAATPGGVALPARPSPQSLLAILASDRLDHQRFFAPLLGYLRGAGVLPGKLTDPVLLAYLARTVNLDAGLEAALTGLRRRALLDKNNGLPPAFLAALARQCRNNEYVFCVEDDEEAALGALADELAARMRRHARLGPELLVYALYRPLARLPGAAELGRRIPVTEPHARAFAAEELKAAREDAAIRAALPTLTPVTAGISAAVARQYEENPYPRWLALTPPEAGSRPLPPGAGEAAEVLVAGCGTGKQAVTAAFAYGPRARLLAVDLSRASLAYGVGMARRLGLANVEFAQADILALGTLERRFDVIECTGVLHHMADPLAGWRVLAGLLKPGGLMRVALYSAAARRPVNACRRLIAEGGYDGDDGIRRFRREVLAGRIPEAAELAGDAADLYSLSEARDLLFHVQEVQFTIPEIEHCLAELGLEFTGFTQPERLLDEVGPHGTVLGRWHRLEQRRPRLFRGMYQFGCRKV